MVVHTVRPGELFVPGISARDCRTADQHATHARDSVSMQSVVQVVVGVPLRRRGVGAPEPWLLERRADQAGQSPELYARHDIR